MYWIARYTVAPKTDTRPLANGLFLVLSKREECTLISDQIASSIETLTNTGVHLPIKNVVYRTSGAADNKSGDQAFCKVESINSKWEVGRVGGHRKTPCYKVDGIS